ALIERLPTDVPKPTTLGFFHAMVERFRTMPKATIGKIEGRARGGGSELLLSLDLRFGALGRAVLAQPEVALGILPGGSGTQRLPRARRPDAPGRARSRPARRAPGGVTMSVRLFALTCGWVTGPAELRIESSDAVAERETMEQRGGACAPSRGYRTIPFSTPARAGDFKIRATVLTRTSKDPRLCGSTKARSSAAFGPTRGAHTCPCRRPSH